MKNLDEERSRFIEKSVPFICESGWNDHTMSEVSEALGEDVLYYKILFQDIEEMVYYFENREDVKMLKSVEQKKTDESIRGYIAKMLQFRIKEISGGKKMLLALRDYYLTLKHLKDAPKSIWNTSDVIWRAAGDKSLDMNYYSKRFLLSTVYTMSIRHYLSDKPDIDEYIDNSLNKVVSIAKCLKFPKLEDIPILRLFS